MNGEHDVFRNNYVPGTACGGGSHCDFLQGGCYDAAPPYTSITRSLVEDNTFLEWSNSDEYFFLTNDTDNCGNGEGTVGMIVRQNKIYNEQGGSFTVVDHSGGYGLTQYNHVYNNSIHTAAQPSNYAVYLRVSDYSSMINNLFYDAMTLSGVVGLYRASGCFQSHNLYYDPDGTMTFSGAALNEVGAVKNMNPLVNNPAAGDFSLAAASPAINAGGPLTTIAAADTGNGATFVVNDLYFFQDGWGGGTANGVQPDCIAVGTVSNMTCIVEGSANYVAGTVTISPAISRNAGDPVWLYKNSSGQQVLYGSAPDIGAYEYVSGGSPDTTPPSAPSGVLVN